jgi:hypothetical protein
MKTEQELQQRLAQLPIEMTPQRDLWPELAARLAATPQQAVAPEVLAVPKVLPETVVAEISVKSGWWLAAAAAVLLTVWAPWQQFDSGQNVAQLDLQTPLSVAQTAVYEPLPDQMRPVSLGASSETQWRLMSDFEQQRALQLAQIGQVPEIYQDWKQQLQIWRQATALVQLALHYQPDEPGLLRQLSQLQQQELAYLQKVVQSDQT